MMTQEPVCVRRCKTLEEAQIITAWLADYEVEATIVDPSNPGVVAFGVTDLEGIAICVADLEAADLAQELLAKHDALGIRESSDKDEPQVTELTCDECLHVSSFPLEQAETVQECPECGNYMDLPAADE